MAKEISIDCSSGLGLLCCIIGVLFVIEGVLVGFSSGERCLHYSAAVNATCMPKHGLPVWNDGCLFALKTFADRCKLSEWTHVYAATMERIAHRNHTL